MARRRRVRVARRGAVRCGRDLVRPGEDARGRRGYDRGTGAGASPREPAAAHPGGRRHGRWNEPPGRLGSLAMSEAAVTVERPSKGRRIVKIVVLDRRPRRAAGAAPPRRRRRVGLAHRALGHPHRDLDRLHHSRLHLPGAADDAHRARVVRDPPLRISRRRDVHGRARVVRRGRRAQQLPPREHRDVRDARHVRRGRPGLDVPGHPRRGTSSRRSSTWSSGRSSTSTSSPRWAGSFDFRFGNERDAITNHPVLGARDIAGGDLPRRPPGADLLALGQGHVGRRRRRAPRSSATSAPTSGSCCSPRWAATSRRCS